MLRLAAVKKMNANYKRSLEMDLDQSFTTIFAPELITLLSICDVGMSSWISKPDHCTKRPLLALLSSYQ